MLKIVWHDVYFELNVSNVKTPLISTHTVNLTTLYYFVICFLIDSIFSSIL